MSLTLYYHPLSSFCMKVLVALYENDTPFTPHLVDLMDRTAAAEFKKIWPVGKFPVLRDTARNQLVPETSVIIDYLDRHYPGPHRLIPADPDRATQMHVYDRMFDFYVNMPMQKIVFDRLRPAGQQDPYGVEDARTTLNNMCAIIDSDIAGKTWIMGDDFTMADCAACPSLFYAAKMIPLASHKNTAAYLERLSQRPSFARVLEEAEPYFKLFPKEQERKSA